MDKEIYSELDGIIDAYDLLVRGIDKKAKADTSRAYGGIVRQGKGKLVENIARHLINIAWDSMGEPSYRIHVDTSKIRIPLNKAYLDKLEDAEIKNYINQGLKRYYFRASLDLHVYIDRSIVLAIECKAYTENAMIKRVLFDSTMIKGIYPDTKFVLLQLESQLGGDYCQLVDKPFGSYSTHTLMSFFDVELQIITLLKGERKVDRPIHKAEYYKPLIKENLMSALNKFTVILKNYK